MTNNIIKIFLTATLAVCITPVLEAQDAYNLMGDKTEIQVTGTSSLHDWEMEVEGPSGSLVFNMNSNIPSGIRNLELTIRSDMIFSGKGIMDSKTRDALLAEKYPEITFRMNEVIKFAFDAGEFTGMIRGILFVAGVKQIISIPFSGTFSGDRIEVEGKRSLKMSDFDIDPPTAMLGTLKTGNEVEIIFNTTWNRYEQNTISLGD